MNQGVVHQQLLCEIQNTIGEIVRFKHAAVDQLRRVEAMLMDVIHTSGIVRDDSADQYASQLGSESGVRWTGNDYLSAMEANQSGPTSIFTTDIKKSMSRSLANSKMSLGREVRRGSQLSLSKKRHSLDPSAGSHNNYNANYTTNNKFLSLTPPIALGTQKATSLDPNGFKHHSAKSTSIAKTRQLDAPTHKIEIKVLSATPDGISNSSLDANCSDISDSHDAIENTGGEIQQLQSSSSESLSLPGSEPMADLVKSGTLDSVDSKPSVSSSTTTTTPSSTIEKPIKLKKLPHKIARNPYMNSWSATRMFENMSHLHTVEDTDEKRRSKSMMTSAQLATQRELTRRETLLSIRHSTVAKEPTRLRRPTIGSKKETIQQSIPSQPQSRKDNFIIDSLMLIFLLPSFDNKGQAVSLANFEKGELDSVTFLQNGFHPRSSFNTAWDMLSTILFIAIFWVIPLYVSFDEWAEHTWLSTFMSVVFAVDTLITLITPQPESSTVLCSFREYESLRPTLRSWIQQWIGPAAILEVIPVIPFEVLFPEWEYQHLLGLLRIARFSRLPAMASRCSLLNRWKYEIDGVFGFAISKIIPILIGMMSFLHYNACTMYYLGKKTGFVEWGVFWPTIDTASMFDFYCWTFYQAVGAMFPLAFLPQTAIEQLFASVYVVISAVLYAAFLGAISSATLSINPSGKLYQQKMEQLSDYVKWKNLSPETEQKLFDYYETKYRGKFFEEEMLLSEMNESLRAEISLQNTRKLIDRVPFLRRQANDGRDEIFVGRIAMALRPQYYVTGDYITKQGDSGQDMFFILSGKVDVFVSGTKVVSLYDGAYIGEVALISKILRTASVQAAASCVLYRLTYHDFHEVLNEFADMKLRISELANEREKLIAPRTSGKE